MNKTVAKTGNSGPKIRSDCEVVLELRETGGIDLDLLSKVSVLYGESIKRECEEILRFFGIINAHVQINDSGALPFVLYARLEAAVKKLTDTNLEYLPELIEENRYSTERDRFRFTRLYLPGNTPSLMINAGLHAPDGIILDLEDSVAPERKDEARILVRNALRQISFYGAERMVRINQGEAGLNDLKYVIPHNVNMILIPKCEYPEEVIAVEKEINRLCDENGITTPLYLMPIIESALGVENCFKIATSSRSVAAMAIGLEDLTADLGVQRTKEGNESFYARSRLVYAAKAAGIQPIDSVFSDIDDMEGLKQNVALSKALGFEGMGCIHPRQIRIIREGFAPGKEEIEKAVRIVKAFENAEKEGMGVVAIGSKMIDRPVVIRAQRTVSLAVSMGLLPADWKNREPEELFI